MNKSSVYLVIALFLILNVLAIAEEPNDEERSNWAIPDENTAVLMALIYTGFDKSIEFSIDTSIDRVKLVTAVDSTTPFLHERINGRPAWLIEFKDILIEHPERLSKNRVINPRGFEVYLDAETGQLLKIRSEVPNLKNLDIHEPSLEKKENSIRSASEEYGDLLENVPKVDFFKALNTDKNEKPFFSKVIEAICIYNSRLGKKPIPMWIITLNEPPSRSFDPDRRHGLKGKYYRRSRTLIDATTGEGVIVIKMFPKAESEKNMDD